MTTNLDGKIAAITGAASGIGLETAKHLLEAGATVFFVDRDAAALQEKCSQFGDKAKPVVVDLLDRAAIATMMPQILEQAGHLDIFYANAGSYVGGNLWESDADKWDRMLNLNINGAFHSVNAVIPHMMERRCGDIIMTSSVAGVQAVVCEPTYTASKHAIQAFVHTMRRQLSPYNIRVGAIQPGPVDSPLTNDWEQDRLADARKIKDFMMHPQDVAEAVMFMLTRRRGTVVRDLVILPQGFDI